MFTISSKAFYERAPMSTISLSQVDSRTHTYQVHSSSESIIKPNERVKVFDKGFGFDFLVSTAPKTLYERAPMPTISSSQADNTAHTYRGHSCSESIIKPNERVEVSDKDFGFDFTDSTTPKAFYERAPIPTISSSQVDCRAHTYQVMLAVNPSSSQMRGWMLLIRASALLFLVSTVPKTFYEPALMHTISLSQVDSKALPTSYDNELDFTFPVPLVLVHSKPSPTP